MIHQTRALRTENRRLADLVYKLNFVNRELVEALRTTQEKTGTDPGDFTCDVCQAVNKITLEVL